MLLICFLAFGGGGRNSHLQHQKLVFLVSDVENAVSFLCLIKVCGMLLLLGYKIDYAFCDLLDLVPCSFVVFCRILIDFALLLTLLHSGILCHECCHLLLNEVRNSVLSLVRKSERRQGPVREHNLKIYGLCTIKIITFLF